MNDHPTETGLDPQDWEAFRARAHEMLDRAMDHMMGAGEGPVWRAPTEDLASRFSRPVPQDGQGGDAVMADIAALMPFGVGNAHPRFLGWVHGAGTPSGVIPELAAVAMNANLGGRHHGAALVEKQVVNWCKSLFGFPEEASGLIVTGTSMATIIALKAARDRVLGFVNRAEGNGGGGLVGYASAEAHACIARAFDLLGLGSDALRKVPVTDAFEMDIDALRQRIDWDRARGLTPFVVIGTAGSVNTGAIDDLDALADIAAEHGMWFHVDGAFGALGLLSPEIAPRLSGIGRAESLAFDFHKWMQVTYDAGCVLIRDEEAHRRAFSDRPDYLSPATRGLSAGNPWPVEYGPELSRGFRALKVWAQIAEHGVAKLGQVVMQNCAQARYLANRIAQEPMLQPLAPVSLNICCFRFVAQGLDGDALDRLNDEIVIRLQESGIAAPSTTRLGGELAIRVNITNHRTRLADMDILADAVIKTGQAVVDEI
ncbi:pyridoxal phosphate-dependent decarboxylase family protein [Shimia biformata]|uniref:pyridoxal phosphate-dependent decarboxylase family protein n=1 Tax=Shimia biformata TaxID=1294299 RepID=UPI00194EF1E4|nr:aspartate aminotransferase family protein [Shimia biformata]